MLQLVCSLLLWIKIVVGSNEAYFDQYNDGELEPSSMWIMGENGIVIYSVDGEKKLKEIKDGCEESRTEEGEVSWDCSYKDAVSDDNRYVWATNTANEGVVEVYSKLKGIHVASLPTCGFPWDMDYCPVREEIWIHCWSPKGNDTGHVDVFSTNALGVDYAQVATGEIKVHGHGTVILDSSLPNTAYATTLDNTQLFEVDLNTKQVRNEYEIPLVSGLYRMAYSSLNKHLYIRAYVCCSCGFEGSDKGPDCGRGGGRYVNVTTGPNKLDNVTGQCGHSCEATPADTIGVYEFDTITKKVLGSHQPAIGLGADPFGSPRGDYIFLFGFDGGQKIQVLKPSQNGVLSERAAVIDCGFSTEHDGQRGASDVTFVQDETHNLVVIASTLSNYIVIADMSNLLEEIPTKKLWLTDPGDPVVTSKHGRGAKRVCTWATHTQFIWCNANLNETVHVIQLSDDGDVHKAKMIKTLENTPSRILLHVHNSQHQMVQNQIASTVQSYDTISTASTDSSPSSVAITALIFALAAVVISIMNFIKLNKSSYKTNQIQSP